MRWVPASLAIVISAAKHGADTVLLLQALVQALGQALLRVQELEAETSDQGAELAELRDYQAKAEATAQTAFGQQMDTLKQVSLPSLHEGANLLHSLWPADGSAQPERCGASHAYTPCDWQATYAQAGWTRPAWMLLRHLWYCHQITCHQTSALYWTSAVLPCCSPGRQQVGCGSHLLVCPPAPAAGVSATAHADAGRQPLLSLACHPACSCWSLSCP